MKPIFDPCRMGKGCARALFLVAFLSCPTTLWAGDPGFAYSRLNFVDQVNVGFSPEDAKFITSSKRIILLDKVSASAGKLVLFDLNSRSVERNFDVPHGVDDFDTDSNGSLAAVIGSDGDNSAVSLVDLNSGTVKTIVMAGALTSPQVRIASNGEVFVSDLKYRSIRTFGQAEFLLPEEAETLFSDGAKRPEDFIYYPGVIYPGSGTVRDFGLSKDGSVLFATDSRDTRVLALDRSANWKQTSQIGYADAKGAVGVPMAIHVGPATVASDEAGMSATVVIGDHSLERLTVTDFNQDFKTFATVADTAIKFPLIALTDVSQGSSAGADGTPLLRSPIMIDASLRQRVILVGNRFSKKLFLFGRNDSALEKVREIDLSDPPENIDVTDDGQLALVVYADRNAIGIIRAPDGASAFGDEPGIGEAPVRELQLLLNDLGYPVGAIDGITGPKTQAAVNQIFQQNKISVPSDDPQEVIRILKGLKSAN